MVRRPPAKSSDTRPTEVAQVIAIDGPDSGTDEAVGERSDDDLMLLAAAGHTDAFRHLVDRHGGPLLSYCAKQLASPALGEEVAQESWLQIWAYRRRYQPRGRFVVLLYTTARNRCRNRQRGARRRARWFVPDVDATAVEVCAPSDSSTQLDLLIAGEKERRVQDGLAGLAPKFREALLLRFDQELDYRTIAAIVGRSESTVRSRVFHGLKKLRRQVGDNR